MTYGYVECRKRNNSIIVTIVVRTSLLYHQLFGIMILRKIDFEIIRCSVIFAAICQYTSEYVRSSDFLSFAFINVVILVILNLRRTFYGSLF